MSCLVFSQINIGYKSGTRRYNLTPRRKQTGKALARRSKKSLVIHALEDPVTRMYAIRKVGTLLRQEMTQMCSDKVNSFFEKSVTFSAAAKVGDPY